MKLLGQWRAGQQEELLWNGPCWFLWVSAGSTEFMHSVLTGTLAVCAIDVVIGLQAVVARNPSSYISSFSLLFIDHPAPTGFSVTVNPVGTQEENAAQYVAAVKTIIRRHNVPLANGLYFSGESYAGQCDFDSLFKFTTKQSLQHTAICF